MKEGSKGKGEGVDDRRRKRTHLRWKDGEDLRGIKTEPVLSENESEGNERVSRKEERGRRGAEG